MRIFIEVLYIRFLKISIKQFFLHFLKLFQLSVELICRILMSLQKSILFCKNLENLRKFDKLVKIFSV